MDAKNPCILLYYVLVFINIDYPMKALSYHNKYIDNENFAIKGK